MEKGEAPIAFDHDCREGICGSCGLMINGVAHGPIAGTATCQLHMRSFRDGDDDHVEPWRARAFPVVQGPGGGPERVRPHHRGRRLHQRADRQRAGRQRDPDPEGDGGHARWTPRSASAAAPAWRPARMARRCSSRRPRSPTSACCRRASPSATGARSRMVRQMDLEGFGGCTLYGECQEACPKEISIDTITRMNRDFLRRQPHRGSRRGRPNRTEPALALGPLSGARPGRALAGPPSPAQQPIAVAPRRRAGGRGARPASTRCRAAATSARFGWSSPPSWSTPARLRATAPSRARSISKAPRSARASSPPGAWGEGFIDRRHPHTYVHELLLSADDLLGRTDGPTRLSLTAGKGFAPFGTDDPMMRPVAPLPGQPPPGPDPGARGGDRRGRSRAGHRGGRPVQRRRARAAGPVAAWSSGSATPGAGGSRAARCAASSSRRPTPTCTPRSTGPARAPTRRSGASPGGGRARSRPIRCTDWSSGPAPRRPTGSSCSISFLAEGAWTDRAPSSLLPVRANRAAGGGARSSRFRSLRPHLENSILGITRWTIHTAGYGPPSASIGAGSAVAPLVEVSYGRVAEVGGGLFDVVETLWPGSLLELDAGVRPRSTAAARCIGWDGTVRRRGCDGARTSRYVMTARRMRWTGVIVAMAALAALWRPAAGPGRPAAAATEPVGTDAQSRRLPRPMVSRSASQAAATMSPSASPRTSGSTATTPTPAPGADSTRNGNRGRCAQDLALDAGGAPTLVDSLILPGIAHRERRGGERRWLGADAQRRARDRGGTLPLRPG